MVDPRNLFSHKQAIRSDNQKFFVGRKEIIEQILDALAVKGASVALFGDGGIGKTSVAWQILELLSGDKALVEQLEIKPDFPIERFRCVWFQCAENMINLPNALARMMAQDNREYSFGRVVKESKKAEESKSAARTYEINIGFFKHTNRFEEKESSSSIEIEQFESRVYENFDEIVAKLAAEDDRELLIFIDEFDKLPDGAGMGKLIKDTNDARFFVLGTADEVIRLMSDHTSAGRKLEGSKFRLDGMDDEEIFEIFNKAESLSGGEVIFEKSFKSMVRDSVAGFPWLAQLIGYHAVRLRMRDSAPISFTSADFLAASDELARPGSDVDRYERLHRAVSGSPRREAIVFALSELDPGWVSLANLRKKLNSNQRKQLDSNLSTLERQKVINIDEDSKRVRFIDPVMRSLVGITRSRGAVIPPV